MGTLQRYVSGKAADCGTTDRVPETPGVRARRPGKRVWHLFEDPSPRAVPQAALRPLPIAPLVPSRPLGNKGRHPRVALAGFRCPPWVLEDTRRSDFDIHSKDRDVETHNPAPPLNSGTLPFERSIRLSRGGEGCGPRTREGKHTPAAAGAVHLPPRKGKDRGLTCPSGRGPRAPSDFSHGSRQSTPYVGAGQVRGMCHAARWPKG